MLAGEDGSRAGAGAIDFAGVGEQCRRLREEAAVSLVDLGRRLHRDPSSLSRFERGLSVPRDLAHVTEAYRLLLPARAGPAPPLGVNRVRLLIWTLGRWAALTIAGLIVGQNRTSDSNILRVFLCASALALAGMIVFGTRDFRRSRRPMATAVIGLRSLITALLFSAYFISRLGEQQIAWLPYITALIWTELGYLAWGFGYYSHER